MKSVNPWELLRAGNAEEGLREFEKAFAKERTASHIMELGVAYLWAERYLSASDHFDAAIRSHPRSLESFFGMAGIAKWCLDQHQDAVRQWQVGLSAEYTGPGRGIHLPLLLFAACTIDPSVQPDTESTRLLKDKLTEPQVRGWPVPIAEFILGQIDQVHLQSQYVGRDKNESLQRRWLSEFYIGIVESSRGNTASCRETMQQLVNMTGAEWSDETFFLGRMWSEEFFFARHETT